jgi:hypothetical protein
MRFQAYKAKIPFTITINDLKEIVHKNCVYCGRMPYEERFAYHRTRYKDGIESDEKILINGIDKVIPQKGYIKENCVPCCKYCNRAKSDLTINNFKNLITMIYKNICL